MTKDELEECELDLVVKSKEYAADYNLFSQAIELEFGGKTVAGAIGKFVGKKSDKALQAAKKLQLYIKSSPSAARACACDGGEDQCEEQRQCEDEVFDKCTEMLQYLPG